MKFCVHFPRDGLGSDTVAARDFAQAAEALGYARILQGDHVVGMPRERGGQDSARHIYEALTLFAYLSAVTEHIGFISVVLIGAQRQATLLAKQAASVDVLSGGRLTLGLGVGWNVVEYDAMDVDFHTRGARADEQIEVMQALWTRSVVDFKGRWHRIDNAGINPLPIQRPIPLWMGGFAESALRRVAKYAEGWFPQSPPNTPPNPEPTVALPTLEKLRRYVAEAGRDPSTFGVLGQLRLMTDNPDDWRRAVSAWEGMGATDFAINTLGAEAMTPAQHLHLLRRFKEELF